MTTGRASLSILLVVSMLASACAQAYVAVQTNPSSPLAGGGLEPGEHVRVELDDGRQVEGTLAYLGAGRYRVGSDEISEASVVSVSRREARVGDTMVVGLIVGVVVAVALVAAALGDIDFGK